MLYSSNIYKFHQVNINDDTLLIDNNERIAKKIESLEPQILKEVGGDWNEEPTDDFFSGLDAEQVDALLAGTQEEDIQAGMDVPVENDFMGQSQGTSQTPGRRWR